MTTIHPKLLAAYKDALSSVTPPSEAPANQVDGSMGPSASSVPPLRFVPAPTQLDSGGLVAKFLAGASPETHAGLQAFHGQTPPPPTDPAKALAAPPVTPKPPTIEPTGPVSDSAPATNAAAGLAMAVPEAGDFHAAQDARIRQAIFG